MIAKPAQKAALATMAALGLSACVQPEPENRLSIVTRGTEPYYTYREDGTIVATACLSGRASGYGRTPSACAVDTVTGQQAAYAHDLVAPHHVGAPYAAPTALAAYQYIYGTAPADGAGAAPQPGVLIPVAPGGAAAPEEAPEG